MGKYSTNSRRKSGPPRNQVPPLVRGIGCITMVLIPILSFLAAILLVDYGTSHGWPIPAKWLGAPKISPVLHQLSGLNSLWGFLESQVNLTANLIFAVAIAIVVGGIMAILYGYVYAMFGPSRYGPTDVPPPRVKTKKYTR